MVRYETVEEKVTYVFSAFASGNKWVPNDKKCNKIIREYTLNGWSLIQRLENRQFFNVYTLLIFRRIVTD